MPKQPSVTESSVSLYDARPFFEKALQYGVQNGIIDQQKLDAISADANRNVREHLPNVDEFLVSTYSTRNTHAPSSPAPPSAF